MGSIARIHRKAGTGLVEPPVILDDRIGTLISQLDELLVERRALRQGACEPDRAVLAAAPHARPCSIAVPPAAPSSWTQSRPQDRGARARAFIRQRRLRSDFLPANLFAEPAWDMLLDLYAAHYEGKPVSVSSLCIAAHVPSTTALRSIEAMEEQDCLVRRRDPTDGRRIFLTLSDSARAGLDAYFDALDG